ncbi:MAG: YceI family protein [Bdellovibrionales bacterium]
MVQKFFTQHFLVMAAALSLAAAPASANHHNKKGHGKKDKMAAGDVYKIDSTASQITWKGTKAVGSAHDGTVNLKDGHLVVNGQDFKTGEFVVDMNTITNKDLASSPDYQTKLVDHLKSEDFFNVTKHPESVFKIKSVKKKSEQEYIVKGELTMIGKTQPVEFPAQISVVDNKMSGTAQVKLDRTKWGLRYGSGKFFKNLGDKMINDEFELNLNLIANKEMTAADAAASK